ncbi:MAG: biotin transporter BioY [Firmicutes bacterium]|nr:biotin transporter BioY [Bacillota bacterium]
MPNWSSRTVVLVAMFTALMSVAAFIQIPLPPVAISLQTLVALLAGLVLGPRLGPLSILVYLAIGLVGVPVFTAGGGISYVLKPSFGYLVGFIPAAWLVGYFTKQSKELVMGKLLLLAACAHLVIYAIGVPYLYLALKYFSGTPVSLAFILKSGFLIFLPGDLLKSLFFMVVAPRINRLHTIGAFREFC